jgi:hypothetical protein
MRKNARKCASGNAPALRDAQIHAKMRIQKCSESLFEKEKQKIRPKNARSCAFEKEKIGLVGYSMVYFIKLSVSY